MPKVLNEELLVTDTIFAAILEYLVFKTDVPEDPACDPTTDTLEICILDHLDYPSTCANKASIKLNSSRSIKNIAPNSKLAQNDMTGNILLRASLLAENAPPALCLTMDTPYGQRALVCKPYNLPVPVGSTQNDLGNTCSNISEACFNMFGDSNPSRMPLFNFSGRTVQCIKETVGNLLFAPQSCAGNRLLNTFVVLNQKLSLTITAILILYVISFAIHILLTSSDSPPQLSTIFFFVFKLILVIYFTLGVKVPYFSNSWNLKIENGITQLALPLLDATSVSLSELMLKASSVFTGNVGAGNGFTACNFDSSKYASKYSYFALWDSIDCRLGFYFGTNKILNSMKLIAGDGERALNMDSISVIVPLLISSFIKLDILIFALLLSSIFIGLFFLGFLINYIASLILLYAMLYFAPVFIPLCLFDKTRQYFEQWVSITISCALQPMVLMAFVSFALAVLDNAMFGTCIIGPTNNADVPYFFTNIQDSGCYNSLVYQLIVASFAGKMQVKMFLFDTTIANYNTGLLLKAMINPVLTLYIFYYLAKQADRIASYLTGGGLSISPAQLTGPVQQVGNYIKNKIASALPDPVQYTTDKVADYARRKWKGSDTKSKTDNKEQSSMTPGKPGLKNNSEQEAQKSIPKPK